jgi:hypothetical protein
MSTMVSMDDLVRWDSIIRAQHALFILDACLSGLAGSEDQGPRDVEDAKVELLVDRAHYLITAGTAGQNTGSSDAWTGSLFTDAIISSARHAAPDNVDAFVTVYKLVDLVYDRIAKERLNGTWRELLTPQIMKLEGPGVFFFHKRANLGPTVAAQIPANRPAAIDTPPQSQGTELQNQRPEPPPESAATPRQFTMVYPDNVLPAATWKKLSQNVWEKLPAGVYGTKFQVVDRTTVTGCVGTRVASQQEPHLEFFIPDTGCPSMVVRGRTKPASWNQIGRMRNIQ